jgi:hypothetical protein
MRYILSFLFVFSTSISFGQMTIAELMKIFNMDYDKFEIYAISKGYEFNKFDNSENEDGIVYVKGVGKQTKYLKIYHQFYDHGTTVIYQTTNTTEIINLKTQSKSIGYKLTDSYFMSDNTTKVEEFKNGKFQLSVYTIPPDEESSWVTYEIAFYKY